MEEKASKSTSPSCCLAKDVCLTQHEQPLLLFCSERGHGAQPQFSQQSSSQSGDALPAKLVETEQESSRTEG